MIVKNLHINGIGNVMRASFVMALVLLVIIVSFTQQALAAELLQRRIIVRSSEPGKTTDHTFEFINPSANTFGSMRFQYCVNSPLFNVACIAPTGLNVNGAILAAQNGNVGFSINPATTANNITLSRVPVGTLSTQNSYKFSNIVNPTTLSQTVFVRISLYATSDGTGISFDQGAVAFSTYGGISVGAYVPPFLLFCVGVTVGPNCSSATGNFVSFGQFTPSAASAVTTQFSAATNDSLGVQVFLNGQTLTSGNNIIPAMTTRATSSVGTSQFGINLRANTNPIVGSNPTGTGGLNPTADYNAVNQFKFQDGNVIARSTIPTEFRIHTVSYLTNVSSDQRPGVYAATLLYTAVALF
jgi:hypothetical protein